MLLQAKDCGIIKIQQPAEQSGAVDGLTAGDAAARAYTLPSTGDKQAGRSSATGKHASCRPSARAAEREMDCVSSETCKDTLCCWLLALLFASDTNSRQNVG